MNGVAAVCAVAGGAYGALAAPALAALVIARKRAQLEGWWEGGLGGCAAKRAEEPGCVFDPEAEGADGVLGLWYESAVARLRAGTLTDAQAASLAEAGIVEQAAVAESAALPAAAEAARYAAPTPLGRRILWAAACAASFGAVAALAAPPSALLAIAAIGIVVVVAFVDAAVLVAPFELSLPLYPVALAYALSLGGWAQAAAGAACALAMCAALAALAVLSRRLSQPEPVGDGDVRLLPACALLCGPGGGPAALLVLGGLPFAAVTAGKLAGREIHRKSRIAMGPHIALACIAGIVSGLC